MLIDGAKGGKGGGGGSSSLPKEAPNTLRSTSKARIIDLLGEGEIRGLVNGMKSIYLDGTPLQNPDGSYNFTGINVHTRNGLPNQDYIPGFPAVEDTVSVDTDVTHSQPVTRTISDANADSVKVTIQLPAGLNSVIQSGRDAGRLVDSSVRVHIKVNGTIKISDVIQGKTTSPYERTYNVPLPKGSAPWQVSVERPEPDADTSYKTNAFKWSYYVKVIEAKLQYPDSALVGLEIDAAQTGGKIPSRAYDVYGAVVQVPSNYNPSNRSYVGIWNGSFKRAWTDNPAWLFYDLAKSMRYGAGLDKIDKWALYTIGRYCDELVPNGYGGQEPRFTVNTVIASRENAIKALDTMASAFRGMTYWGANAVMPVADMPATPVLSVSPANVIGGEFSYTGSGLSARHSVVLASWNDPDNDYRLVTELVEHPDLVEKLGWKPVEKTLFGCTSRGLAHRMAQWILYTEQYETEVVNYTAGMDHAELRPGDLVQIHDPSIAGARLSGRFVSVSGKTYTLDKTPTGLPSDTWYLDMMLPNGSIERRQITSFKSGNRVDIDTPFSRAPIKGAVWLISSQSAEPLIYRVLTVQEKEDGVFAISALRHYGQKFDVIEQGLEFDAPDNSLIPAGPIQPPLTINIEPFTYDAGGKEHQGMTISWSPSRDPRVLSYVAEVKGPEDEVWRQEYSGSGTSFDLRDTDAGQWEIRVAAFSGLGQQSAWASLVTQVAGLLVPVKPDSVEVKVGTLSATLIPQNQRPQEYEFWIGPPDAGPIPVNQITQNARYVGTGASMAVLELKPLKQYWFYIRGTNVYGKSDFYSGAFTTEGNVSVIMDLLSGKIKQSDLWHELSDKIDMAEGQTVAIQDLRDDVNGIWGFKIDNDGLTSGMIQGNDGAEATTIFRTDTFAIAPTGLPEEEVIPFIFSDGALYLKEALIQNLTFTKLTDSTGNFVVNSRGELKAQYIDVLNLVARQARSSNYIPGGVRGWALNADGSFDLAGPGTIGGDVEFLGGQFANITKGGNLVAKPNFEDKKTGGWRGTGASVSVLCGASYSRANCYLTWTGNKYIGETSNLFAVTAGEEFKVVFDAALYSNPSKLGVGLRFKDKNNNTISDEFVWAKAYSPWRSFTGYIKAPANAVNAYPVNVLEPYTTTGSLAVTNIVVQRVDSSSSNDPSNLIRFGDGENWPLGWSYIATGFSQGQDSVIDGKVRASYVVLNSSFAFRDLRSDRVRVTTGEKYRIEIDCVVASGQAVITPQFTARDAAGNVITYAHVGERTVNGFSRPFLVGDYLVPDGVSTLEFGFSRRNNQGQVYILKAQAYRLTSEDLRVSTWTRPNTTLISGNKIFAGDAYVDTLQIKGHAVTVPLFSSGGQGPNMPADNQWRDLWSVYIEPQGGVCVIDNILDMKPYYEFGADHSSETRYIYNGNVLKTNPTKDIGGGYAKFITGSLSGTGRLRLQYKFYSSRPSSSYYRLNSHKILVHVGKR